MDIAFEQKIRQRAYEIWLAAGMEDGDAESHWLHAERTMLNETQSPAEKPAKRAAAPKSAATKVTKTAKMAKPAAAKAVSAKTVSAKAVSAKKTATKAFAKARPDAGQSAALN